MKKALSLFIFFLIIACNSQAQFSRYIIKLKDKGSNPFSIANPSQYLSARALERRARYNILIDSSDLPVTPRYLDSIQLSGAVTILNVSKWLNQVAIRTTDAAALAKINSFPFVISTAPLGALIQPTNNPVNKQLDPVSISNPTTPNIVQSPQNITDYYNYGQSAGQVRIHHGEFLHNHGFRGETMQMAILDAGFYHYQTLPTFDSIRNNNQVLGTWDFVANEASVNEDNSHGMNCLSTIAANMPGIFMGTAPKTSFYLFRTEDVSTEYPIEEQNWAAGAEKADSLGVDICSTSLGYTQFDNAIFNYTYSDMNGNTTISARAADFAAKKGMLIVVAAGNEGSSSWHYLSTPSDADSAMCVGAVDVAGNVAGFSSYGPSSDGQIKPAVAAVGLNAVVASTSTGLPVFSSGTSFACPNMAGITTCLWQAFPEINNMGIINALELSANRANNPDNRTGYGVPNAKKAFVMLIKQLYSQQVTQTSCNVNLQWTAKTDTGITVFVERKLATDIDYNTINTQTSTGSFAARNFVYLDDLTAIPTGTVRYRIKMQISADTTFYLDSVIVNHAQNCSPQTVLTTSTVNGFGDVCIGEASTASSFTISGANLPANNITVSSLNGYSFSTSASGNYTATLSLAQPGGSFSQIIYVKFMPLSVTSYNGDITVSCGGNSVTVSLSGSGINTTATMVTAPATAVTTHQANLPGTINSIGCSELSAYGIEFSTTNNFSNGTGIRVQANNNVAGDFAVNINTLLPGTTYYYKAYGTNNGGTAYGSLLSFTTVSIPDALTIYSSPVAHSGNFHYSINGITAGNYLVQIYNSIGQLMFRKEITVDFNFIDDSFILPTYLSGGMYSLKLSNTGSGFKAKKSFVVN